MDERVFEELAAALDRLPNGFPRTMSGVEILILKKIFSEGEALLAGKLGRKPESVDVISKRLGMSEVELKPKLVAMAKRGLLWMGREGVKMTFRLAPFVVGIYEASLENMDHEFAHLFEEYMAQGGAAGIMKPQPALHRVVPVQGSVKSEWILPYDDIRKMLEKAESFRVSDCICRVQQDALNKRRCDFPIKNCLTFSPVRRPSRPNDITKDQTFAILGEAEEVGLVHCVSNVIKGVFYVCNCCGCCCGVLRGVTEYGIEGSIARANYYAEVDADTCTGCGVCADRCQVRAITMEENIAVIDHSKCVGCGLCVSGCPVQAVSLERRDDTELVHPPDDFTSWEELRLKDRGLSKHT